MLICSGVGASKPMVVKGLSLTAGGEGDPDAGGAGLAGADGEVDTDGGAPALKVIVPLSLSLLPPPPHPEESPESPRRNCLIASRRSIRFMCHLSSPDDAGRHCSICA